jgi:hypothetical protein
MKVLALCLVVGLVSPSAAFVSKAAPVRSDVTSLSVFPKDPGMFYKGAVKKMLVPQAKVPLRPTDTGVLDMDATSHVSSTAPMGDAPSVVMAATPPPMPAVDAVVVAPPPVEAVASLTPEFSTNTMLADAKSLSADWLQTLESFKDDTLDGLQAVTLPQAPHLPAMPALHTPDFAALVPTVEFSPRTTTLLADAKAMSADWNQALEHMKEDTIDGMKVDWLAPLPPLKAPDFSGLMPTMPIHSGANRITTPLPAVDWNAKLSYSALHQPTGPVNVGPPKLLAKWSGPQWTPSPVQDSGLDARVSSLTTALGDSSSNFAASVVAFKTSVLNLQTISHQTSASKAELLQALDWQHTGGWYGVLAGGAVLSWVQASRTIGSGYSYSPQYAYATAGTVPLEGTVTLAEHKAMAAREAAVIRQVTQLTEATQDVTTQLAELQAAKATRDYEVATMKSDLRALGNQLDSTLTSEQDLRQTLAKTQTHFETETAALRGELQERMAAETAVQKNLAATEKKLQKEMQALMVAKESALSNVMEKEAQVVSLAQEKKAMQKEIRLLQSQVAKLAAELETTDEAVAKKKAAVEAKRKAARDELAVKVAAEKEAVAAKVAVAKEAAAQIVAAKQAKAEEAVAKATAAKEAVAKAVAAKSLAAKEAAATKAAEVKAAAAAKKDAAAAKIAAVKEATAAKKEAAAAKIAAAKEATAAQKEAAAAKIAAAKEATAAKVATAKEAAAAKVAAAKEAAAARNIVAKKAAPRKVPPKKTVTRKVAVKRAVSKQSELEPLAKAFFANITEPVGSSMEPKYMPTPPATPPTAVKVAKAKKSVSPKTVSVTMSGNAGGDWSHLSLSALKRKTVKDLKEYLASKVC